MRNLRDKFYSARNFLGLKNNITYLKESGGEYINVVNNNDLRYILIKLENYKYFILDDRISTEKGLLVTTDNYSFPISFTEIEL